MNPARVFAIQAQKSSSWGGIAGGVTEVDQAFAAGLCAGMRRECYLAGRLKWARDKTVQNELFELLEGRIKRIKEREKIDFTVEAGERMIKLAMAELMEPIIYKTNSSKALILGVHPSNYGRTWQKKYDIIFQELDDLANRAFSHIMIRQRYGEQDNLTNTK